MRVHGKKVRQRTWKQLNTSQIGKKRNFESVLDYYLSKSTLNCLQISIFFCIAEVRQPYPELNACYSATSSIILYLTKVTKIEIK